MSSNKLLAIAFVLSICIFTSTTKASEQILATITTDVNSDSYQFILDVNEDQHNLNAFYIDNFRDGKLTKRESLPMQNFLNEGLSLPIHNPRSFAKINGENFDLALGGNIIIDTLYNAVTGKRKSYELQLSQNQEGWKLFYRGGAISKIIAIANKLPIVGVVGAKNLYIK